MFSKRIREMYRIGRLCYHIFKRIDLRVSSALRLHHTVNVDCVKFEYVVLAKYHHMLIFEFDLLTKQHILICVKSCSSCVFKQPMLSSWVLH